MAKAVFHKNQRVYVHPVGTWASIEALKPQWVKGVDEPLKVLYDVGLGRDFQASELQGDGERDAQDTGLDQENWRLLRARNKWQEPDECKHHPMPGTYPVVVTDAQDWGGWRVPGAEYDRDPARIEFQARVLSNALRLLQIAGRLSEFVDSNAQDAPADLRALADDAHVILRHVYEQPQAADEAA